MEYLHTKFENFVKEIYDKTLIKISNKNLSKLGIKEKEIKDYHKLSKEIGKRLYSNSTKDALKRLNEAAYRVLEGDYGHMIPAAIDAARAKATIGEICDAFKEPFGWGHSIMAKV